MSKVPWEMGSSHREFVKYVSFLTKGSQCPRINISISLSLSPYFLLYSVLDLKTAQKGTTSLYLSCLGFAELPESVGGNLSFISLGNF